MLIVEDVSVAFGGIRAVNGLSTTVEAGKIHGLIGPNGSGKTTVLNAVTGIVRADQGRIVFRDGEIRGLRPDQVCRRGISRTFQTPELFPALSVLDNVLVGGHTRTRTGLLGATLRTPLARREKREAESEALALLEFVGLRECKSAPSTSLPFGLQRLVDLARALASAPVLLLLDEPAAGMSAAETDQLEAILRAARTERGVTILLVDHDMRLVMRLCDRITVLNFGRKIAEGSPRAIRDDPGVVEAYLGRSRDA